MSDNLKNHFRNLEDLAQIPEEKWYAEYFHGYQEAIKQMDFHNKNRRVCTFPRKHRDRADDGGELPYWKIEYQREKENNVLPADVREYEKS